MGGLGAWEILILVLLALLLFGGGRKLADLGKGLGEGIRGFRDGMRGDAPPPTNKDPDGPRSGSDR